MDLEGQGFVFNNYDACVANGKVNNQQYTIRFHVDNKTLSHKDAKVNGAFGKWCQAKCGSLKDVKIHRGKAHQFLGMELDFFCEGECKIKQFEHARDMIEK